MEFPDMVTLVSLCTFQDYEFSITRDRRGSIYLQGSYDEPDTVTGQTERQVTRRWYLNPMMTKSEIVQTVFKCALTSMEHRTREWFRYRGKGVFGPHFDVDMLWELCLSGHTDARIASKEPATEPQPEREPAVVGGSSR